MNESNEDAGRLRGGINSESFQMRDTAIPATSDNAALIEELERRTLDYWMEAVTSTAAGSAFVHQMQNTLSWRITRPIRIVRSLQIRASNIGYARAIRLLVERRRRAALDKRRDS